MTWQEAAIASRQSQLMRLEKYWYGQLHEFNDAGIFLIWFCMVSIQDEIEQLRGERG